MPLRVAIEPYLRSFQYKVLNSFLYTNELHVLCKIGYISDPNCSFCHQTTETISHIFFIVPFLLPFGMRCVKKFKTNLIVACASR